MGFLSGLFGAAKKQESVEVPSLDSWLEARIESEAKGVVRKSERILGEIAETAAALREDVEALDKEGFSDLDPRFDKIVRTAKPAYVKSMRSALSALEKGGSGLEGIIDFEKRLSAALDTIGKTSFGDGKFLNYPFQERMNPIQSNCRRLLDEDEALKRALSSNARLHSLRALKVRRVEYDDLRMRASKLRETAAKLRADVAYGQKRLTELNEEVEVLRAGAEYAKVTSLKDMIAGLESEVSGFDSTVHMVLSPVASSFRKYSKTVLDGKQAKIISDLKENPVDAFLSAGPGDIEAALDGFANSCRIGAINLKDPAKTLGKIEAAKERLTDEFRIRWKTVMAEIGRLRMELDALSAATSEPKLLNDIHSTSQLVEKQRRDLADAEARAREYDGKADRALEDIRVRLGELDVELVLG
jgi:hypothetical protein